ncbi:hypothetical protein GGF31_003581 [Allomyces arbusculus]|nr:hypothetical protein GGF31_003581 [Allomyces arbusculus]
MAPNATGPAAAANDLLPVVPLFGARILYPGVVLRLSLRDGDTFARLDDNALVACVPVVPSSPPTSAAPASGDGSENQNQDADPPSSPSSKALVPRSKGGEHQHAVTSDQLAEYGCMGRIVKTVRARIGPVHGAIVLVEGLTRVHVDFISAHADPRQLYASVSLLYDSEIPDIDANLANKVAAVRQTALALVAHLQSSLSASAVRDLRALLQSAPADQLSFALVGLAELSADDRITLLSQDLPDRLDLILTSLRRRLDAVNLAASIRDKVGDTLSKKQRELLLRQQLEVIKKELGELDGPGGMNARDSGNDDVRDLEQRLTDGKYPEYVVQHVEKDLKRAKAMNPAMAEYHTLLNHADWMLSLPWTNVSPDAMDLGAARAQLDADHHGLEPVKTRILEFLAVRKLRDALHGPILCLHGPPGVGKTSLGKSIAAAMGRQFARIALGGVRDEAELRGHRRTYVGAMPGVIVQTLKKAGTRNPVVLLDEIDKLGRDPMRGDPAAALLEILDPEQNAHFTDHYLNVPLDLSQVLFVATCNSLDTIPRPLLDRMEVIDLPGYTPSEKTAIAATLLTKQHERHGLPANTVRIEPDAMQHLLFNYTREAGVRNLERSLATICRAVAVEFVGWRDQQTVSIATPERSESAKAPPFTKTVRVTDLRDLLGGPKYDDDVHLRTMVPGLAVGLAYTGLGTGSVLFVEATQYPGKGRLQLTGQLGKVLQESGHLALTWLRTHAHALGLVATASDLLWADRDVHVHLPAGAVAKDGPSAGVTLATALVSLALGVPVRRGVAMTGELTLRGDVLPVGGIVEKALAAHRMHLHTLVLPERNRKDADDIPQEVRDELTIVFCAHLSQVLRVALDTPPTLTLPDVDVVGAVAAPTATGPAAAAKDAIVRCYAPKL